MIVTVVGANGNVGRLVLSFTDRTAVADAEDALRLVAATDLDWTAVCAPSSPGRPEPVLGVRQAPAGRGAQPG